MSFLIKKLNKNEKENKKFQKKGQNSLNKLSLFQKMMEDFLKMPFVYKECSSG